jgi:hypothetical protein
MSLHGALMPSSVSTTRLSHHWIIPCGDRWFRLRSQTIVKGHLRFYVIRFDVRRTGSFSIHFRKLRSRIKRSVGQPDVGGERHETMQDRSEPATFYLGRNMSCLTFPAEPHRFFSPRFSLVLPFSFGAEHKEGNTEYEYGARQGHLLPLVWG